MNNIWEKNRLSATLLKILVIYSFYNAAKILRTYHVIGKEKLAEHFFKKILYVIVYTIVLE